MTQNKFWLVWSPQGKQPPKKRYETQELAIKASKKLAESFPKQDVFVTEATHHFKAEVNVVENHLSAPTEIPTNLDTGNFKVNDKVLLDNYFQCIVDDYIDETKSYKLSFMGGGYAIANKVRVSSRK